MVGGDVEGWKVQIRVVTFLGLASYATLYCVETMIFTVLFNYGKLCSDFV